MRSLQDIKPINIRVIVVVVAAFALIKPNGQFYTDQANKTIYFTQQQQQKQQLNGLADLRRFRT